MASTNELLKQIFLLLQCNDNLYVFFWHFAFHFCASQEQDQKTGLLVAQQVLPLVIGSFSGYQ